MNEAEKLILESQIELFEFLRRIKETCSNPDNLMEEEYDEDTKNVERVTSKIKEFIRNNSAK